MAFDSDVISALRAALPLDRLRVGNDISPRHFTDWSKFHPNRPRAVVLPRSTEEVSRTLAVCCAFSQPIVPQGGMTGLVAGAHPEPDEIVLSLEHMAEIEEIDGISGTLTALAGTSLETIQTGAEEVGFLCGLDLGARGSCSVGGNVAINAGGNKVIRYGMARQNVLGLEAVLADGTIIRSLNKMLKDNSGYDLKQLFIGSEGTLGVITRVVLRLMPQARSYQCALLALPGYKNAIELLHEASSALGGTLSSFELMWPEFYDYMTRVVGVTAPIRSGQGIYLLLDAQGGDLDGDAARFERFLSGLYERGMVSDAVVAGSIEEGKKLWQLRDLVSEFTRLMPGRCSFDVSFPLADMQRAVDAIREGIDARWPGATRLFYGHIGDSNLHILVYVPGEISQPTDAIETLVYDTVRTFGGAVSAEHGIGRTKRRYLSLSRTAEEIELMRALKRAFDPKNILNPNKVI